MADNNVLLRCNKCRTVNRVPTERLNENPRCGKCKSLLEFAKTPVNVTAGDFDREILAWPGAVLVEFWAPWCGYCRMMEPVVNQIAGERAGYLKIAKINVDNEPLLGSRFSINATPMFFMYRKGIKISDISGFMPKARLEAWIDSSLLG